MADQAAKVENCPPPQDIKQLQRFLGIVNFYRHFLPNCAQVLKPLTDHLKGGAKSWSGPLPLRRLSKMLNASWQRWCHSNTLPPTLNFLPPLTPPILISEGSCSKNHAVGVWPVGGARSIATHALPPNPSPSLNRVFLTFMWIWWAHYSIVTVLIIFLPLFLAHLNGWKLFHLLRHPWQHELRL
jgi:hypothetical protein